MCKGPEVTGETGETTLQLDWIGECEGKGGQQGLVKPIEGLGIYCRIVESREKDSSCRRRKVGQSDVHVRKMELSAGREETGSGGGKEDGRWGLW